MKGDQPSEAVPTDLANINAGDVATNQTATFIPMRWGWVLARGSVAISPQFNHFTREAPAEKPDKKG